MAYFSDNWRAGGIGKGGYEFDSRTTSEVPLTLKLITGQVANALEIKNASGTTIFSVSPVGNVSYTGSESVTDALTVTGATNLLSTLGVTGVITLTGGLIANSTATFNGEMTANSTLNINNVIEFDSNSSITAEKHQITRNSNANLVYNVPLVQQHIFSVENSAVVTVASTVTAINSALVVGGGLTVSNGATITGQTTFSAGTAALPSITFASDKDTGIYSAAANTIGFTVGTVNVLRLSADASGSTVFDSSSATAGTQYHKFKAAADELAIGTGGFATHNVAIWTSLSNSGTPAFLMRYGGGGTRSFQLVGDYTLGQTTMGLSSVQGQQMNFTDSLNASKDHDHAAQTNPTIYVHSALDPDVSNNQWGCFAHNQEDFIITTGAETGTGTGATTDRNAISFQPRGAEVLVIAGLATSGTPTSLLLTGSAHTGITAATECIGVNFNLSQTKTWATGAGPLATQREILFQAPTYAGNAGGALTITDSGTVVITGAPIAGTNITLTRVWSLWVQAGVTQLSGGVAFATTGQSTLSNYTEGTFTPTVTLVGGAGNTVPVYTTNTGRYMRIGNRVFVDVYLTGDGGAEGAGTGTFSVALPITAGANHPTSYFPCGHFVNGTAENPISGQIPGSATVIDFVYEDVVNNFAVMTGAEQNNVTRTMRLKFSYEV